MLKVLLKSTQLNFNIHFYTLLGIEMFFLEMYLVLILIFQISELHFNGGGDVNQTYICQTNQFGFILEVLSHVKLKNTAWKYFKEWINLTFASLVQETFTAQRLPCFTVACQAAMGSLLSWRVEKTHLYLTRGENHRSGCGCFSPNGHEKQRAHSSLKNKNN